MTAEEVAGAVLNACDLTIEEMEQSLQAERDHIERVALVNGIAAFKTFALHLRRELT